MAFIDMKNAYLWIDSEEITACGRDRCLIHGVAAAASAAAAFPLERGKDE
jgi:hypothetical protein